MNPLIVWQNMKPAVKITIVICATLIIIASMVYGYFDDILGLFGKG
jgi:hypothetical protein